MFEATRTVIILSLIAALAGCTDSKIQSLGAEASIDFEGEGSGEHSDRAACDDEGRIKGSGEVTDGSVTIGVSDADGTRLFDESYKGTFTLDEKVLEGHEGTWVLSARRGGDDLVGDSFRGSYQFHLNC